MNEMAVTGTGEYYNVKVQNGYVKGAYKGLDSVEFSKDIRRAKNLTKEEMEYVLEMFPEAETRKYNVTVDREW
jgi:hypothetical protein